MTSLITNLSLRNNGEKFPPWVNFSPLLMSSPRDLLIWPWLLPWRTRAMLLRARSSSSNSEMAVRWQTLKPILENIDIGRLN